MILAILKTIGLVSLIGPALFVLVYPIAGDRGELLRFYREKFIFPVGISAALYVIPSIIGALIFDNAGPDLEIINLILVPVFALITVRLKVFPVSVPTQAVLMTGLSIIIVHSLFSHSGYQVGLYPLLGTIIHLLIVTIWSGGLFVLMTCHFVVDEAGGYLKATHIDQLKKIFSQFTLFALLLLVISGAILMTSNVHNFSIMGVTKYGSYLTLKLYLSVTIIFISLLEILRIKRNSVKKSQDHQTQDTYIKSKYPIGYMVKTAMVVLVLIYSGLLTHTNPPDTAPFLNPQTWQISVAGQEVRIEMQPVAGSTTEIRFEAFLPDQLMQLRPVIINFDLYLSGSDIGTYGGEAVQVSQNSFQGEATVPAPGDWQLDLDISMQDGSRQFGRQSFSLPAQPLIEDIRTYLSLDAISYSTSNLITFIVGAGLVFVYGWLTRRSFMKDLPSRWVLIGLSGLSLGIYMLMSVILVKTYPSTYWIPPQDYTLSAINQGKVRYGEHCEECHGATGSGDGPWAVDNRGRIPDLGSPHMDVHTDGEIYWWIIRGIPSLEMPTPKTEISETDIWNIIYYVRSLRHGLPSS